MTAVTGSRSSSPCTQAIPLNLTVKDLQGHTYTIENILEKFTSVENTCAIFKKLFEEFAPEEKATIITSILTNDFCKTKPKIAQTFVTVAQAFNIEASFISERQKLIDNEVFDTHLASVIKTLEKSQETQA